MFRIRTLALLLGSLAIVAAAPAATPQRTTIKVAVPAKVKVGKEILVGADVAFDPRLHKPPTDYLKAAMYRRKGSEACPKALPVGRKAYKLVVSGDYDPEESARVEFETGLTIGKAGRYRFCAYAYADHYAPGDFEASSHRVKARAAKLVTAAR